MCTIGPILTNTKLRLSTFGASGFFCICEHAGSYTFPGRVLKLFGPLLPALLVATSYYYLQIGIPLSIVLVRP